MPLWFAAPAIGAVNVSPNTNGLPGITELETIVGALLTVGVVAALGGLVIAAIVWAVGNHSANPTLAGRGKTGVLVACVAAILVGGAVNGHLEVSAGGQ